MKHVGSWRITVQSGLRAHFLQQNGPSKPGTDWAVELHNGASGYRIFVRAYAEDVTGLTAEQEQKVVVGFLRKLIQEGWTPPQCYGKPIVLSLGSV